jgi:DNA-binding CsgD family transcriptional regulator
MNQIYYELDNLVELLSENNIAMTDNYDLAFDKLKSKADASDKICQIVDFEKYSQVYFNPVAENFFGTTNKVLTKLGFAYVFKYLHPYNFNIVQHHIAYFSNPDNYNKVLSYVYYVNTSNGWKWLYNCTKVSSFTKAGKAKYLFVSGVDISEILSGNGKYKKIKKNINFINEYGSLFYQLTNREKEILSMIIEEKSSIEIGEILHISNTTVDTHRNNIIKKLQVKSSVGLVKYAIMFDLI